MMIKYKRILLKLSGEALMGKKGYGIDEEKLTDYARQISEIHEMGVEIGIVVGGGNIFRGLTGIKKGVDRIKGDYMGMLATVINGLAMQSVLEHSCTTARLFTAISMTPVGTLFSEFDVLKALQNGEVAIFTFGTGNPFFTTDTAASLRAVQIKAEVLLKGTRVDGIYTTDPEKDKNAIRFDEISFDAALEQQLHVMDLTAFTLCKENNLPILVFNINTPGNLKKIVSGSKIGTLVKN
jgi:uridylate kinase